MKEEEYRLDKTAFKAMTVEEADEEMHNYKSFTWKKRVEITNYLNSIAYNFSLQNPPRMDKTFFEARALSL